MENTEQWLMDLMNGRGVADLRPFRPTTLYVSQLDELLFVLEDCSWRCEPIDCMLSLLLHPYEERVVGVKIAEARVIVEAARAEQGLSPADPVPAALVAESAFFDQAGPAYDLARRVVGQVMASAPDEALS